MNFGQVESVSMSSLVHMCAMALEADPEGTFQGSLDELVIEVAHQQAADQNNGDCNADQDEDRHDQASRLASRLINAGYSEELQYLAEKGYTPAMVAIALRLVEFPTRFLNPNAGKTADNSGTARQ